MSRRRKHPAHENHERWLVSYADFITLLFAFFVVMFASSQTDKGKAQRISDSVTKALEENQLTAAVATILGGTVSDKGKGNAQMKGPGGAEKTESNPAVVELTPSLKRLTEALKQEIERGMLQISMEPRGLVVSLRQAAFFPSGQDNIDPRTYPILDRVIQTIQPLPNKIRLEGHTDAVPIHNERFRSNWDLSTARGVSVLELLQGRYQVPVRRLSVGGYAETVPITSNDTEEGRAKNRRVDVVILNEFGLQGEPAPGAKPKVEAKTEAKHH